VFPPTYLVSLPFISFSILYMLLALVFIFFFAVGTLSFKTRFNGMLLGLFVVCSLILRINDLKHPLFLILLAAFFIALEFFFNQSGKKHHPSPRKENPKK
jgi:hypothetical protein